VRKDGNHKRTDLRSLPNLSLDAARLRRDVIAGGWATTFKLLEPLGWTLSIQLGVTKIG